MMCHFTKRISAKPIAEVFSVKYVKYCIFNIKVAVTFGEVAG